RSKVNTLTLQFTKKTYLDSGAFTLTRRGGGVSFSVNISSLDNITYTLSFSGSSIVAGSLADGIYDLIIDPTKVHSLAGVDLTGSNLTRTFHRLFGDANGDGMVDGTDLAAIRASQTANASASGKWYFDCDGNNNVDVNDYNAARTRSTIRYVY